MNGGVDEWVAKAEGDYGVAGRELAVTDSPNYDAVCFDAQQCTEKLMKAMIIQRGETPPKTHDLRKLDRILKQLGVDLQEPTQKLRLLSMSAVLSRCPGKCAEREDAVGAFEPCSVLHTKLQALLNA
jgi:HEPN domain-containing protein